MSQIGNIRIEPGALRGLADRIHAQRVALDDKMNIIQQRMMSLRNDGWDSASGEALRTRFNNLRTFYDQNYPPAMQDYINFLNNTAQEFENQERERMAGVEGLSNKGQ